MNLLKALKALLAKGFATAAEKAAIQAMVKEATEEDKEAVKEEIAGVEALPEEDPKATEEQDEAVKSVLKSIDEKVEAKVSEAKAKMEAELKEFMKTKSVAVKQNSIESLLSDEAILSYAKTVKSEKGSVQVELKDFDFRAKASVAGDISIADDYTGTRALSELEAGVSRDPQRQPFIEQLVSVGTISSPIDVWIETTNEAGDPLPKAELAALPQKEWDFAERTAAVRKIGVYAKYSAEMAEDLPNLVSEIRNFLIADLRRVVDTQILTGSGSGENLVGILQNATAYSAGSFAGTVLDANNFDVIETAVTQVIVNLFNPNYVVVHPIDQAKMNLAKGNDGHYVLPPFISQSGQVVSGVRVISNTGITADNFLVGDFSRSSVKYRRGLTVEMTNTDQDDFIKDRFTVKATVRLVHRVKENDYGAFVKGVFSTQKAALEAGS
jgi:hypothetical protein